MEEDSFWKHSLRFLFEIWDELSGIVSPLKSVATSVVVLVVGCIVALYVRRKYQKVEKLPPPGVLGMEVLETVRPFASVTCIRTDAMFQDEMSALKAVASPNICFIVVADAVFHAPMLAAKAAAWLNIWAKSVTAAVFHEPMG